MVVKVIFGWILARTIPQQSGTPSHRTFTILKMMVVIHAIIHSPVGSALILGPSGDEYNREIISKVVCQGQTLKIRCPNNSYALDIHEGSYGRTQPGNILCPYKGSEYDFYFNCGEYVITDKLIQICKRKKKCMFKVEKAMFGDPCRGHAYLNIIYSCVKKKRRKHKNKPVIVPNTTSTQTTNLTLPTRNVLTVPNTTSTQPTNLTSTASTLFPVNGLNSSDNSTLHNNDVFEVLFINRNRKKPGIFISIIVWFLYVKSNRRSFITVFLITLGIASFFFLVLFGLLIFHKRVKEKRREKRRMENPDSQLQKINTLTSSNCDIKKRSEQDTLSNTFPALPSALPPPPDDMVYPSPSPDMINSCRPNPPPANRGCSLDDISKLGQDTRKHVPVTRSISLRTRPPNYIPKELNFNKLPNLDNVDDIQAVIIQRNNGSTMYMNPMYGNIKQVTY